MVRFVIGSAVVVAAGAGCHFGDTLDGLPPAPAVPPAPIHGACTTAPRILAQVDGVLPRPMAIDSANLYVVASPGGDPADESLWRVPLSGGPPQLVADGLDHVGGVTVDTSVLGPPATVLWSTGSTGADGAIWRSDPAAGTIAVATHRAAPGALLVVGRRVYWAEGGQAGADGGADGGSIQWAPVTGGDASTLVRLAAEEIPRTLDGDEQGLVWTTEDLALGNATTAEIAMAPLPLPFGPVQRAAQGAAAVELTDWGFVYSGPDAIVRFEVDASGAVSVLQSIPTGGFVEAIEEDATHVFYVDPAGALREAAIDGDAGTSVALAHEVDRAAALQADGTCVYWIDAAAHVVRMVRS